jgi:hypothetical protein
MGIPVYGQDRPERKDEIKAVVRISKRLIEDVVSRKEIVRAVPYNERVLGFDTEGVIHGKAHLSIAMNTGQGQATFIVNSQGSASTYVHGVRGPIVAMGPAWGPLATRTLVRFDGRHFTVVETVPWAEVHGELERVEGRHGRRFGRVVGRLLLPIGRRLVPRAEAEATPIAERILTGVVNELGEEIVTRLNRTTQVEKSLNRVFPESKDWVFQLAGDSEFLQAAYGPRGSKVPALPKNPGGLKDVRIELWLHSTNKEAAALVKLTKVPLAKKLVQKYLEALLPELTALAENRSVDAVGEWLVISIGAPKEGTRPVGDLLPAIRRELGGGAQPRDNR